MRVAVFSVLYYLVVLLLLLGVLFELWGKVVSKHVAGQVGHNSEGYVAALVIPAWIQFVRPKLTGKSAEWIVTIIVGLAFIGLTIWMLESTWPSRFRTLNEGTLAIGLVVPYVQLRRPLPRRVAACTAAILIIGIIATFGTTFTTNMAETWGIVLFAVVGFDLIDRGILEPAATTSAVARWTWYAFLIIAPIVFSLWENKWGAGSTGPIGTPVRWIVRINESFVYAIFTEFFLAVLLGWTGIRTSARPASVEASDPSTALV